MQKSLAPLFSKYSSLSSCQHILLSITPKNKKPREIRGVSFFLWYRAESNYCIFTYSVFIGFSLLVIDFIGIYAKIQLFEERIEK
jgi:hypothetical protein